MVMLLTDPQKAIYNLIASGGAFKNPYQPLLNQIINSANTVISELPSVATVNLIEQDALEERLDDLKAATSNFIGHTNRVSGVVRLRSGTIPDINQLFGVSRARQQLKLQFGLNEDVALASGLELFASLYLDPKLFSAMTAFNNSIIVRLSNAGEEGLPGNPPLIPPTPAPPNPQIPFVMAKLSEFISFLQNAPVATDAAYYTALEELYTASMMYELSTFAEPATTTEHVVDEQIGTNTLLDLVEQQKTIVDNR